MLHYKIRYIEYRGHIDDFVFDFDEACGLLSTFLSSDVTPFDGYIPHHDIHNGVFQFVEESIHKEFTHIGENSLYGGK